MNSDICTRNCEGCPVIRERLNRIELLSGFEEFVVDDAAQDDVEESAEEMFERIEAVKERFDLPAYPKIPLPDGEIKEVKSAEDVAAAMRMGAAMVSSKVLGVIDEIKEEIDDYTYGCVGQMTMRARRHGMLVHATLCMSPLAPDTGIEEVRVTRQIENN